MDDFDLFFASGFPRTTSAVYLIVADLAEAEDIAQEAYARAAVRWEQVSRYEDPEGWVRRVAANLAVSTLRRRTRWLHWSRRHRVAPAVPDLPTASAEALDLQRALARLPLRYRAVLTLHYLMDLSVEQVAEELGVPVATVRTRLARGRAQLLHLMQPAGAEEEVRHG